LSLLNHLLSFALQGAHAAEQASGAAQHGADAHAGPPAGGEIFTHLYHHVLPEREFYGMHLPELKVAGYVLPIWNLQIYQVLSVVLVLGLFLWAMSGLKSGRPNRAQRTLIGFVLWIRDEMAVPVLGHHHAHALLPYFLTVFFFIAASNLIGLFPFGSTSTACIYVTGGWAITTLAMMIGGGMIANGPVKFWLGLVPHGIPAFLWPLMFIVEVIGLLVKPFSLTIRLFANMTAGHLVVLSLMGLIFYFGQESLIGKAAYAVAPGALAFAVFIMIIEAFVALLQAYIFTLLSMLFVGASLHPEH